MYLILMCLCADVHALLQGCAPLLVLSLPFKFSLVFCLSGCLHLLRLLLKILQAVKLMCTLLVRLLYEFEESPGSRKHFVSDAAHH